MSRQLLARAWAAGAGPGDSPLTIDLDSSETYGRPRRERDHGYTGAALPPAGEVLMSRLRECSCVNGGAGALPSGHNSASRPHWLPPPGNGCPLPITIRQRASLRDLIEAIPGLDSHSLLDGRRRRCRRDYLHPVPDAAPVRLIVRRVNPTPGSQLALFARYSYHETGTARCWNTDHRENAIR